MPRRARRAVGGEVYHVLNRAVGRMRLFRTEKDYLAFERVLEEAHQRTPGVRILAYTIMPNHWHLVLWPRQDGELSAFMFWLTMTHTQRWRTSHHKVGLGPLYQGRFKAFPIQRDEHLLTVLRYVDRNPLRAKLVEQAGQWRWGSLWREVHGEQRSRELLCDWPVERPGDWVEWVQRPQTAAEEESLRTSVCRGRPFGAGAWQERITVRLGLESSFRRPGRPGRPVETT